MTNLVIKNKSWRHLLRDLKSNASFRNLNGFPADLLSVSLLAPATLASWLSNEHPLLLEESELHLVIAGASRGPDSIDGGRWYQFIPLLVGKPSLKLKITFLSPELSPSADNVPFRVSSTGVATMHESAASNALKSLAPAEVVREPLGPWFRAQESEAVDACFVFQPGMEAFAKSWFSEDLGLPSLIAKKIPIGLSSSSIEEMWHDQWLTSQFGFKSNDLITENPFQIGLGEDKKTGKWGQYVWSLNLDETPSDSFKVKEAELIRFHLALEQARPGFSSIGNTIFGFIGGVGTAEHAETKETMRMVGLPPGLMLSLDTGEVYGVNLKGALEVVPIIHPLDQEMLETFPGEESHPVDRYIWACETFRERLEPYLYLKETTESLKTYFDLFETKAPILPPTVTSNPLTWPVFD